MLRLTLSSGDLIIDNRSALAAAHSLHCLASEDDVRRLLLTALTTPSALDALRRFFARWNSEAWRVNVINDRMLIERVARMTVNGPLAAFVVYNKPTLNTDRVAAKLARLDLSRRSRKPGPPTEVGHEAVKPPTAIVPPSPVSVAGTDDVAEMAAARVNFGMMELEERFDEVLRLTLTQLAFALRGEFERLLNSDMRVTTVGVLTTWASARDLGTGFMVDSLLSMTRIALRGSDMIGATETLYEVTQYTLEAREDRDLEYAAELLADAVETFGVDAFIAMIAHGATRLVSSAAPGKPPERLRPPPPRQPPPRLEQRAAPAERRPPSGMCLDDAAESGAAFVAG